MLDTRMRKKIKEKTRQIKDKSEEINTSEIFFYFGQRNLLYSNFFTTYYIILPYEKNIRSKKMNFILSYISKSQQLLSISLYPIVQRYLGQIVMTHKT